MIIYKLKEINERIEEMKKNINSIKEEAENDIQKDIQVFRSKQRQIENNSNLSAQGKDNELNKLSHTYYDKYINKGAAITNKIQEEYDKAIERIKELKQFDDERKIVNISKADSTEAIKQNTSLMYAIQVLNNIDEKYNHDELIKLFDNNQESEKILTLIKMKGEELQRKGVNTDELNKMMYTLDTFNTDYVAKLENEKLDTMEYCKNVEYPRVITLISLRELFEVEKTDIAKFSALNNKKDEIESFFVN